MKEFYGNNGWSLVYSHTLPAQQGTTISSDDLDLSSTVLQYLKKRYVEGLYVHQHTAIHAAVVKQQHTCMTTGTASGKTLPFMVAAMNLIVNNPHSKILALYPMKALGYEQERRWQEILNESRVQATVGRIDGDVATAKNFGRSLKSCATIVKTLVTSIPLSHEEQCSFRRSKR